MTQLPSLPHTPKWGVSAELRGCGWTHQITLVHSVSSNDIKAEGAAEAVKTPLLCPCPAAPMQYKRASSSKLKDKPSRMLLFLPFPLGHLNIYRWLVDWSPQSPLTAELTWLSVGKLNGFIVKGHMTALKLYLCAICHSSTSFCVTFHEQVAALVGQSMDLKQTH